MPHDAYSPVTVLGILPLVRAVSLKIRRYSDRIGACCPRCAKRLLDRRLHGMKLMIPCHLLGEFSAAIILKYYEIPEKGQKTILIKKTLDHHLQFWNIWTCQGLAGDRPPGLEPLPLARQSADTSLGPIRNNEKFVHGKEHHALAFPGTCLLSFFSCEFCPSKNRGLTIGV